MLPSRTDINSSTPFCSTEFSSPKSRTSSTPPLPNLTYIAHLAPVRAILACPKTYSGSRTRSLFHYPAPLTVASTGSKQASFQAGSKQPRTGTSSHDIPASEAVASLYRNILIRGCLLCFLVTLVCQRYQKPQQPTSHKKHSCKQKLLPVQVAWDACEHMQLQCIMASTLCIPCWQRKEAL